VKNNETLGYWSKNNWFNWVHEVIWLSFEVIVEQNFRKPFVNIDALIKPNRPSIIDMGNLQKDEIMRE